MYYPTKFPTEARDRVEAVKIRAGQKFDRDRLELRNRDVERLLRRCILRVFRMFVREAKRLRVWCATDLDWEAREFLRQLTIELYSERGFDNCDRRLARPVDHISGGLLPEVRREFEHSPEWRYFEAARLAMALPVKLQAVEAQTAQLGVNIEHINPGALVQGRPAEAVPPQPVQTAGEAPKKSGGGKKRLHKLIPKSKPEQWDFIPLDNYHRLSVRGVTYLANDKQAAIINLLDKTGKSGLPKARLLHAVGVPPTSELRSLFQREARKLYKALIEYSPHSRTFRLRYFSVKSRRKHPPLIRP
jgi:hypothetical protein